MAEWWKVLNEPSKKWVCTTALCVIWYVVSLGKALLAKYISTRFKAPLTLSFIQLVSISIYSIPLLYFCKLKFSCLSKFYFYRYLLPLSLLKALTTASGHLAIWNISVSYSQIMRASMPIFTALFCWILFRTRLSLRSYLTLVSIVVGVCVTTVTESDFSLFGMICGLVATSGASLQTIYNKELMDKSNIHSFQLTALLGWVSTLLFFPAWFSVDGLNFIRTAKDFQSTSDSWQVIALLVLDGFTNFIQNVVAFAVLYLVLPTSYAVGNIAKRPLIIAVSIWVFKNTVSLLNLIGIAITLLGASLYTYFELEQDDSKEFLPGKVVDQELKDNDVGEQLRMTSIGVDESQTKTKIV